METVYVNPANLSHWQQKARPSVIALGFFDGIHIGHRKVIETAAGIAEEKKLSLSVMSFFPHPRIVLSSGKTKVDYLMPLSDKEKVLRTLGVDTFYIVEFDIGFASLSPEQFASQYLTDLGIIHVVAGFDYSYGHKGVGNMGRLKSDSGGLIEVTQVPKVESRGEKISSTCIREKLSKGTVEDLPDFLGRLYEVECDWDGVSLQLRPYYTLPAPGRYAVTIHNGMKSEPAIVIVTQDNERLSLRFVTEIGQHIQGRLTIIWHRHIPDAASFSSYKREWNERTWEFMV
ncbi:bifunctional riboflavin kinase/FMN adenylyltransferase [Paenibacillus sp. 2RAB27]|uniref:FAD synthetase family protein n=1 Tax=Paenibacillus sp. 2RAB27 TaxID=3232991 RepID=UPI003F9D5E5A